jgi:potassium uptake TrkH family protein
MHDSPRDRFLGWIPWLLGVTAMGLLLVLVRMVGWRLPEEHASLRLAISVLAVIYAALLLSRVLLLRSDGSRWRRSLPTLILAVFLVLESAGVAILGGEKTVGPVVAVLALSQIPLLADAFLRLLRMRASRMLPRFAPGLLFLGSFVALILLGTLLLKLPRATTGGITWVDALFTSTSAACVTGLATIDPALAFTPLGHFIILLLIQAGGLGVMTLTYFIAVMAGQGISLRDRVVIRDMLNEDSLGQTGKVVRRIVLLTLGFEVAGAIGLWFAWRGVPGAPDPLFWHCCFHSISAFCNAGFSTLPGGLTHGSTVLNLSYQAVIIILIVGGGLGFAVYHEGWKQLLLRWRRRRACGPLRPLPLRWTVHWRLATGVTALLLAGGTLLLYFCDSGPAATGDPALRWWRALFNSVTCRTAGFNVTDIGAHALPAALIMISLMFVGGSPGGTAGGIKTTTFAVALLELWRMIRGRSEVIYAARRIGREVIERSFATLVVSLIWIGASTLLLSLWHPKFLLIDALFEVVSAFGTVGLSRGLTTQLEDPSKLLICLTMLAGRVGVLSFVLAFAGNPRPSALSYPEARLPLN